MQAYEESMSRDMQRQAEEELERQNQERDRLQREREEREIVDRQRVSCNVVLCYMDEMSC